MHDYVKLSHELIDIDTQIKELRRRKQSIVGIFKSNNKKTVASKEYFNKPIWLYILKLEGGNFYVGMTRDVDARFKRHSIGKGAVWTKIHKPIEVIDRINTGLINETEAAILEDNLTLQTAENFGYDVVRGGKWCSPRGGFPSYIREPEKWTTIPRD